MLDIGIFQLGFDFEDYELVLPDNELWILESLNKVYSNEEIDEIRQNVDDYYNQNFEEVNKDFENGYSVIDNVDERYGNYLLNYLNNYDENIKLTRRILNE